MTLVRRPTIGLFEVQPDLGGVRREVLVRLLVEPDPVTGAGPATLKVGHDLGLHLRGPGHVLPGAGRLVHQGVVVGVAVAEDEAGGPVGRVPVGDRDAQAAADLAEDALRDVEAMVKGGALDAVIVDQPAGGGDHQQRGLQVPPQDRLAERRDLQVAAGVVAQRAGVGVLADGQAVQGPGRDLGKRNRGGRLAGPGLLLGGGQRPDPVRGKLQRVVAVRAGQVAAAAETSPASGS